MKLTTSVTILLASVSAVVAQDTSIPLSDPLTTTQTLPTVSPPSGSFTTFGSTGPTVPTTGADSTTIIADPTGSGTSTSSGGPVTPVSTSTTTETTPGTLPTSPSTTRSNTSGNPSATNSNPSGSSPSPGNNGAIANAPAAGLLGLMSAMVAVYIF